MKKMYIIIKDINMYKQTYFLIKELNIQNLNLKINIDHLRIHKVVFVLSTIKRSLPVLLLIQLHLPCRILPTKPLQDVEATAQSGEG